MSTSGLPPPNALKSIGTRVLGLLLHFGLSFSRNLDRSLGRDLYRHQRSESAATLLISSADERFKQRMWLHRFRFELRMELAPEEPRMPCQLADFDVSPVRRLPRNAQSRRRQLLFV